MLHEQWDISFILGLTTMLILTAGSLGFAIPTFIYWLIKGKDNYESISGPACLVAIICFLIFGAIGTAVVFPFSGAYNRYVPISGMVTQTVNSRFLSDGNGTTQNFLVTINGYNYRCDDTRCAQLVKGDKVTLMCEKSFQFNATSGYICNWGKLGLNS